MVKIKTGLLNQVLGKQVFARRQVLISVPAFPCRYISCTLTHPLAMTSAVREETFKIQLGYTIVL